MSLRKRMFSLALALMTLPAIVLSSGMVRSGDRSFFLPEQLQEQAAEGYVRYENSGVRFALEVPDGYAVTEPYENAVLISDGDDFRLSAEYAFFTADQSHFIRSAADFAALIEADQSVLTDWVGSPDVKLLASGQAEVEGKQCYVYAFTLSGPGGDYSGALYLFDGQGQFGCYCLQGLLNESSDKASLYAEQSEHMVKSFTITGPYQAQGYVLYEMQCEGAPVSFLARDTATAEQYTYSAEIFPVDGIYSKASVDVDISAYDSEDALDKVLKGVCDYYFEYWDDAAYTAQPSHFDLGQYSYDMQELACYREGERYDVRIAVFLSGGQYWEVTAIATDEYKDPVDTAFSDTLFSLRVNNDAMVPAGRSAPAQAEDDIVTAGAQAGQTTQAPSPAAVITGGVGAVLDAIEAQEGFGGAMTPIGCVTDLDGGAQLLLAVYEITGSDGGAMDTVFTDAWLIGDGAAVLLARDPLYDEVGGNSGSVAVARKDGQVYMEMEAHLWQGDAFNNYYGYLPLDGQTGAFGDGVYMEAHGSVGQEDQGQYIIGDRQVDKATFDAAQDEYVFDLGMPLNIQLGPGNGNVLDFAGLRHWYP